MKCDHCGAEMKAGAKVCPECGMKAKGSKSPREALSRAAASVKDKDMDGK